MSGRQAAGSSHVVQYELQSVSMQILTTLQAYPLIEHLKENYAKNVLMIGGSFFKKYIDAVGVHHVICPGSNINK